MILTYVCFLPGTLVPADLIGLVERHDIGFEPEEVRSDALGGGSRRFSAQVAERVARSPIATSLAVTGERSMSLRLGAIAGYPGQVLISETERFLPPGLVDEVSTWPGFVAALAGDGDDVFWQSADQVNTYELHDRPWRHLPTMTDEVFNRPKIDVSRNPGRQTPVPMMWLWAASRMWFGAGAFALIDRERLLASPVGRINERPDGVVVVELFDLGDTTEHIRERQVEFRSWLGYDEIAAIGRALAERFADPRMTVEVGEFESGGVRRITQWRADEKLVPRSMATEQVVVELDQKGSVVRRDVRAV